MNLKKIIKTVLFVVGFIFIFGAVGKCDYMVEIGQYYPIGATIKPLIVGLISLFAGVHISY